MRGAFVAIVYLMLLGWMVSPVVAQGTQLTLLPGDVISLTSFYPEMAATNAASLDVGFNNAHKLSLLRFSLPKDLQSDMLMQATLSAYLDEALGEEQVMVDVYPILSPWCGEKMSWNTKPSLGQMATTSAVFSKPGWVSWDITALVQTWIARPDKNEGIALGFDRTAAERRFGGKGGKNPPQLTLTVSVDASLSATPDPIEKRPCKTSVLKKFETAIITDTWSSRLVQFAPLAAALVLIGVFMAITHKVQRKRR